MTEEPARGWSTLVVGSLAAGILGAMAFIAHEARARAPMLPLSLFRERNFTIGNLATLTAYLGLGGVIFLLPVFLQEVSGYSPVQAGLALLPVTSLMIVLSRRFGALADRIGSRVLISLGALVAGCGLLLLARVDQRADYVSEVLPALLVFGLGLAMLVAPLTATVLGAVEEDHAGVAAAVNTTLSRVAQLFAVAVLGAVVSLAFASRVDATLRRSAIDPAGRPAISLAKRQPLGAASLEGVRPGERLLLRAAFERCGGARLPRRGHNRSRTRRRAEVSLRSPGSAIPAAPWPPSYAQPGRSAEPAKNSSMLATIDGCVARRPVRERDGVGVGCR